MTIAPVRHASTIIVFDHDSYRILMVKRSRQLAFFPNAWVFPGGRVDEQDEHVPVYGDVDGLSNNAFAVAAVRECFEEAGVWLGAGTPSLELRDALNHRKGTLLDEPDLVADLERLTLYSRWITPIAEPKRYDTLFFLTQLRIDEHFVPQADQSETVDSGWFSPQEMIDAHYRKEVSLAPPTLLTLLELAQYTSVQQVLARNHDVRPIMPVHRKNPDLEILLPGHIDHGEEERGLLCDAMTLIDGVWKLSFFRRG